VVLVAEWHPVVVVEDTTKISREEWLELRRQGLGGSDAGAVAGFNRWTPPLQVWSDKLGLLPPEEMTESAKWGLTMEPVLVEEYRQRHPDQHVWVDKAMYRHGNPDRSFMLANIDARIGDDGLLECKTADKDLADEWIDGPPLHYQLQVQHYLEVLGLAYCMVIVLIGGNRFHEFRIERDDELIATLVRMEEHFWASYVLDKLEPPMVGTDAEKDLLGELYHGAAGEQVVLPPPTVRLVHELVAVKAELKRLETEKTRLEDEVKVVMKDATEGVDLDTGQTLITWRPQTRRTFNEKAFKATSPYLFSTYVDESESRTFLVKIKES
jgi:putative phage-type endonuclease